MCGISVILDQSRSENGQTADMLERMHESIRHRGPDGEGYVVMNQDGSFTRTDRFSAVRTASRPRLAMAFRRLKIIDLTEAASQPMGSEDGSIWLVFNGEIYNFRQLRRELEASGRRFRTRGDTEVALAAYERWGEDCFARFEGMWAIVLADQRKRRIVASRDRFGIKPLFWAIENDRLFLASEAKQIIRAHTTKPHAHSPLVRMYLEGARYPCLEETFFRGIRAVPPATFCEISLADGALTTPRFQTYWTLSPAPSKAPTAIPHQEAQERLRDALESAVDSHRIADVRVGSLLSGGLDSGVLASLLIPKQRKEGIETPTFSFGFRDRAPDFCELRYVDRMVERDRWLNHETTFDPPWVLSNIEPFVATLEEPPLAMAALAQYKVFQLCREHDTTVVFDGQGADEILGGYPYYQRIVLIDHFKSQRWGDFSRELWSIFRESGIRRTTGDIVMPILKRLRDGKRHRPHPWISADYGERFDGEDLRRALTDRGSFASRLSQQLYFDVKWGNVKIVLGYADRNAMAFSVEARVPYFDRSVVELAFSLPDDVKVGAGKRKKILRDVAQGLLPAEVLSRRERMGFGTPDAAMIRGTLWPAIREKLLDSTFLHMEPFDEGSLRRFVDGFEKGKHRDHLAVWRLWMLAIWSETYRVQFD